MAKTYRNHVTEVVLDFGCLGENYCDVVYDWMEANPSNDPFQPPEEGGAIIKDVLWFVNGVEVSIMSRLSPDELDKVADQIWEQWQ
jgi:hypothetical protein